MHHFKKALALALAMLMAIVPAYAAGNTVTSAGSSGTTPVELTADAATFSVTVPTSIAIHVNADGTCTCPSNVELTNESTAAVKVTKIEMKNGTWTLVPYTTNMAVELVDAKKLGFQVVVGTDTIATTATGNQTLTHNAAQWTMPQKDAKLSLGFSAVSSAVSSPVTTAETAASIIFTVAWAA